MLGILMVGVGVLLTYFSFIFLIVITLIDWCLYLKTRDIAVCYQCSLRIDSSEQIAALGPFNLVLHDHYRKLLHNRSVG